MKQKFLITFNITLASTHRNPARIITAKDAEEVVRSALHIHYEEGNLNDPDIDFADFDRIIAKPVR